MTKRRHGLLWLFALALLCAQSGAWAQSASDSNTPDPKTLALSTQLLDLAGMKPMLVQLLDQISPSLTRMIEMANPGKEAQVQEVMGKFIMPKMKEHLPEIIDQGALIYAK